MVRQESGGPSGQRGHAGEIPGRGLVSASSILTGQVDDVVGEIELDGFKREIGVRDLFAKDHVSVAVVTGEGSGFVGPDVECPDRNSSAATFWS